MTRLKTVFYESFALNRPSVARIAEIAADTSQKVNFERLREQTNLGNNYIKSMPRYAVGAGLLEDRTNRLTPLGKTVLAHDPDLNHPATLWLMHYHLSAPKGPGPAFWHYFVTQILYPGERLERSRLLELLGTFLSENSIELSEASIGRTVTVFTGTYTKSDALGKLGVFAKNDYDDDAGGVKVGEPKVLTVGEPNPPPTFALGYALAHFWEQEVNALRTNLSSLSASGGFSSIFFLGSYALNSALRDLQREGFVELEQVSPPHHLVRRWEHKEAFLERLYD